MSKKRNSSRKVSAADAEKALAKKARRAERQREEAEAKRTAQRKRMAKRAGYGAIGLVAVVALAFGFMASRAELSGVERPPDLGRIHLDPGETPTYASATPTSGPHFPSSATCGMYQGPIPKELAVHALEHGAVVVWYRPDLPPELVSDLGDFIADWDSHVIVSPNPEITDPIVATAWNRLKRFDLVDDSLSEFVSVYRNRGPESVPCPVREI